MWEWLKRKFGFGKKAPERPSVPDAVEPADLPRRSAGEGIPDRPPEPTPVPPSPPPQPASSPSQPAPLSRGVDWKGCRIYIQPDKPWERTDREQGFETGDGMTIIAYAGDEVGRPIAGVPVRGIIDLTTGNDLPTEPKHGVTGDDGKMLFRYTMRAEDQRAQSSKLITAVFIDGDRTITPKPTALVDALSGTDLDDPFFRGE